MKIVYLFESQAKCGGNRSVYEHINRLIDRGHEVELFSKQGGQPDWFNLKTEVVEGFEKVSKADILVVPNFTVAKEAIFLKKGVPFLLEFGYTPIVNPDPGFASSYEESILSPINILCNASWLKEFFKTRFLRDSHVISNAIDLETFKPHPNKEKKGRFRILIMYHIQSFKGIVNGLEAFDLLRKKIKKEVELHMFGAFPRPNIVDLPFYYYFNPSEEEIAKIYSSSDLFVFPSVIEGFPKPPLEAMACRIPVVLTDCLGIRDYAKNGENCLIIPPSEPERLSGAMIELIGNDELREKLADQGHKTAQEFSYERVIDRMEAIFQKALECVDDSLTECERVARITPSDPWAHYNLGLELYGKGKIDRAGHEFEKTLELNPHFTLAYKELEKLLFQSIKKDRFNAEALKGMWNLVKSQI